MPDSSELRAILSDPDKLTAAIREAGSVRQLAATHGYKSHDPITKALARFQIDARSLTGNQGRRVTYEDKKPAPTEVDIGEFFAVMKQMQKKLAKLNNRQTSARLTIPEDKPVGIILTGDWHIGAVGVDYDLFESDMALLERTEGIYLIGMGDYKDNYLPAGPHPQGMLEQIAQPGAQDLVVQMFVNRLKGKWLAMVRGCHDDFEKRSADKDFLQALTMDVDTVNLWHGGRLDITVGDFTHRFTVKHKMPNHSNLNTTNANRRAKERFGGNVFGGAHYHTADQQEPQSNVYYLRSGSYKCLDEYGQKLNLYEGEPTFPMLIAYPNQEYMQSFRDMREGIRYLEMVRK